jgi:Kef-type K+ transport system membrane component KefB
MAELGKLLLMFFAGLDIDLALFRRARNRAITFGIATTALPLVLAADGERSSTQESAKR